MASDDRCYRRGSNMKNANLENARAKSRGHLPVLDGEHARLCAAQLSADPIDCTAPFHSSSAQRLSSGTESGS